MKTNEIIQKHEVADSSAAIMKSTDEEIRNLLSELGFSSGSKGYKYLVHIIKLGMNNINDIIPISNGYSSVAKIFKTTKTSVENVIWYTIKNAYLNGDPDTWKRIFKNPYSESNGRPTTNEFIITVVEYLGSVKNHEEQKTTKETEVISDEYVKGLLKKLGVSSTGKGYLYLTEIIKLGLDDINNVIPISKGCSNVVKIFKKTNRSIENVVRYTIKNAYLNGDNDTWKSIFGNSYFESKGKPATNEFIITVVEYLCSVKNHEEQKTTKATEVISDEYVRGLLKKLGVSITRKGYVYLTEIIKLGLDDIDNVIPISKGCSDVAKIFKTTKKRVEDVIWDTIKNAYLNGDHDTWKNIFKNSYSVSKRRPTTNEFIITVVEYLGSVKNHEEQKTTEATKVISDECVKRLLKTLGVSVEGKGYVYLTEIIKLGLDDINNIMPITKNGYPRIAKIFKTKATNVDRAIRYTIEKAAINGNTDTWEYIFSSKRKPTNTYFVITLVKYLKSLIKEPKLTTESIKKASP